MSSARFVVALAKRVEAEVAVRLLERPVVPVDLERDEGFERVAGRRQHARYRWV